MAKGKNSEQKVEELLLPITKENNFELVDVEFVKEGPNWYLRAYIDKEGGVSIDDCELISRALEKKLDESEPIEQAYILEVCSPGIDRPLKKESDFIKYAGEMVDVKLYTPKNGQKEYQGALKGLVDGIITITLENGDEIDFVRKEVANIRLAVIF